VIQVTPHKVVRHVEILYTHNNRAWRKVQTFSESALKYLICFTGSRRL